MPAKPTVLAPLVARFIHTADWHAEQFRNLAKEEEDFLTSRAKDLRRAVRFIKDYMLDNGITTMIHGGDVFHKQNEIEVPIYNMVYDLLKELKESGLQVIVLKGNHDETDKTPDLTCLRPLSEVVDQLVLTPQVLHVGGAWLFCIPYQTTDVFTRAMDTFLESSDFQLGQGPKLLVAHIGVSEARLNESMKASKHAEVATSALHANQFDLVLLGHYHLQQKVAANIYYSGAPLQHNFGDCGQTRGFLDISVYADGSFEVTPIPIPGMPAFHEIPVDEYNKDDYPETDFVKLVGASLAQQQEFKDDPRIRGAKQIKLDEIPVRINIGLGADWEEAITKYVDYVAPDHPSRQYLIDVGVTLLKGENE